MKTIHRRLNLKKKWQQVALIGLIVAMISLTGTIILKSSNTSRPVTIKTVGTPRPIVNQIKKTVEGEKIDPQIVYVDDTPKPQSVTKSPNNSSKPSQNTPKPTVAASVTVKPSAIGGSTTTPTPLATFNTISVVENLDDNVDDIGYTEE